MHDHRADESGTGHHAAGDAGRHRRRPSGSGVARLAADEARSALSHAFFPRTVSVGAMTSNARHQDEHAAGDRDERDELGKVFPPLRTPAHAYDRRRPGRDRPGRRPSVHGPGRAERAPVDRGRPPGIDCVGEHEPARGAARTEVDGVRGRPVLRVDGRRPDGPGQAGAQGWGHRSATSHAEHDTVDVDPRPSADPAANIVPSGRPGERPGPTAIDGQRSTSGGVDQRAPDADGRRRTVERQQVGPAVRVDHRRHRRHREQHRDPSTDSGRGRHDLGQGHR